jgi:hypothetical protein
MVGVLSRHPCPPRHLGRVQRKLSQIDSSGGRIRADSICLNVSVEIRGIAFLANLIVIGTQGIDVILGMNWLDKYQAVISCDKRAIKLMSPLGEEVVTELVPPEPKKGSCYQMAVDSSEARLCLSFQMCFQRTCQVCHQSGKLSLP